MSIIKGQIAKFFVGAILLGDCNGQDLISGIDWDRLAPKASENVSVNVDGFMLSLAGKFLSAANPDEAQAKKLIKDLKGVYVRSLKFKEDGAYNMADVEKLRKGFSGPAWSKVVEVKNNNHKGENVGIYIKNDGAKIEGIVVLAAEPRELTVVQVVGSIDPEQLKVLGDAGIVPKIGGITSKKKTTGKDDE